MTFNKNQDSRLAIIVKKLLNIFAALPNCQSTGGVSIEMAKPICKFFRKTAGLQGFIKIFITPEFLEINN
jgi:hypothetical protein